MWYLGPVLVLGGIVLMMVSIGRVRGRKADGHAPAIPGVERLPTCEVRCYAAGMASNCWNVCDLTAMNGYFTARDARSDRLLYFYGGPWVVSEIER